MGQTTRTITGYCPHIDDTHSVEAVYDVTLRSGGLPSEEKCTDLRCKHKFFSVCKVKECPLEKVALSYNS